MTLTHRFSDDEHSAILAAVQEAERRTSGEIRVFIDRECGPDVLDRAAYVFEELGMHKTDERNGILIYLAIKSRKFAVIGDSGIHAKVGDEFWSGIRTEMQHHFMAGDFVNGLRQGILKAGEALSTYFPWTDGDRNELSDEIAYGDRKEDA